MNGQEFTRRARKWAKTAGMETRFEAAHGKGSHGRFFVGERFTTVKRGEISTGLLAAMLKQLNIPKKEF